MRIITDVDSGQLSIGTKRNNLLNKAREINSEYVCFFDDDDMPGPNYIKHQLAAAKSGKDSGSLIGAIYFGKIKGKPFIHSIKYDHWYDDAIAYYRCPNHLNAIRLEHYEGLIFPETNFGEDGNMSMAMQASGRLKTEHECNETIYHYFTGAKDFNWQCQTMERICI